MEVAETADARKEKINHDQAWELLSAARTLYIAKGKKILTHTPDEAAREEILKSAMGRSGNLRAPTLKKGDAVLIGFNDSLYPEHL
ncbi:MAG: hypothetical protein MI747_11545 [Desulfobacterales bacterium]|nr:hypothetical protein [Desulfobacterales bacterium]